MAGYAIRGELGAPKPDIDGFRDTLPDDWKPLLIGPIPSIVNDTHTLVFLPDGSKEGWGLSDDGDKYREQLAALFSFAYGDGSSPFGVVHVRFGGDEPGAGYEPELIVENRRGPRITSPDPDGKGQAPDVDRVRAVLEQYRAAAMNSQDAVRDAWGKAAAQLADALGEEAAW